jgi:hypothetical protein
MGGNVTAVGETRTAVTLVCIYRGFVGQPPTAILYRYRYWRRSSRQLPSLCAQPVVDRRSTGGYPGRLSMSMLDAATGIRADIDPTSRPATAPRTGSPAHSEPCQRRRIRRSMACPLPRIPPPIVTGVQSLSGSLSTACPELPQIQEVRSPYLQERKAGARFDGHCGPESGPARRWPVASTRQPAAAAHVTRSQLHDGPHGARELRQPTLKRINHARGVHG